MIFLKFTSALKHIRSKPRLVPISVSLGGQVHSFTSKLVIENIFEHGSKSQLEVADYDVFVSQDSTALNT